jgi:putative FmdB family regulatory protein
MPNYDFSCHTCDYTFEKNLRIADCDLPTQLECPNCSNMTVSKDICAPGLTNPVPKAPADFQKYVLGRIAANNPGSTIERTRSIVKEI